MDVPLFVVCCLGSGLCDELITLSEESYRARALVCVCVCVELCVIYGLQQCGDLGPSWYVAHSKQYSMTRLGCMMEAL